MPTFVRDDLGQLGEGGDGLQSKPHLEGHLLATELLPLASMQEHRARLPGPLVVQEKVGIWISKRDF